MADSEIQLSQNPSDPAESQSHRSSQGGKDSEGGAGRGGARLQSLTTHSLSISMSKKMQAHKKIDAEIRMKKTIRNFIEGKVVTVFMSIVTVYALIGVSLLF